MPRSARCIFIEWLLDDRGLTKTQVRKALGWSQSKLTKALSPNVYTDAYYSDKLLDEIEHTVSVMRPM